MIATDHLVTCAFYLTKGAVSYGSLFERIFWSFFFIFFALCIFPFSEAPQSLRKQQANRIFPALPELVCEATATAQRRQRLER